MIQQELLDQLILLRRQLHMNAELSGSENNTRSIVSSFIRSCRPDKIIPEIGKTGIAFVYEGSKKGPVLLLRSDMDAVPVDEVSGPKWKSLNPDVSHKCGHDGHMAIMAGLAAMLAMVKPACGSAVLLFQPSEENGKGAFDVINDPEFSAIEPDFALALHNVPGFDSGSVLLKEGTFSMASKGLRIMFRGISAHACNPAAGVDPTPAVANFIDKAAMGKSGVTICHVQSGEPSFGLCPGFAHVYITVRAESSAVIQSLCDDLISEAGRECEKYGLTLKYDFHDEFPETKNNKEVISLCRKAAALSQLKVKNISNPFAWSEDFGYFTGSYKAALIGLGAGKNVPPLHHPGYDFPDDVILPGVSLLYNIVHTFLSSEK
jgi:amidohydrolase